MTDTSGVNERSDRDLWLRCRLLVEAQSLGEWGDDVIDGDADKLYDFVMRERTAALAGRVVVPREPSEALIEALVNGMTMGAISHADEFETAKETVTEGYRAMIAAAVDGEA